MDDIRDQRPTITIVPHGRNVVPDEHQRNAARTVVLHDLSRARRPRHVVVKRRRVSGGFAAVEVQGTLGVDLFDEGSGCVVVGDEAEGAVTAAGGKVADGLRPTGARAVVWVAVLRGG